MTGMANESEDYLVRLGYKVVLEGELSDLRKLMGMSRNAQAQLIGVEGESLKRWEQLNRAMNIDTALRVGEWYWAARKAMETVPTLNFDLFMPASRAAQYLGVPLPELDQAIFDLNLEHERLGVLGTFVCRKSLAAAV